jgi:hypothetical protein
MDDADPWPERLAHSAVTADRGSGREALRKVAQVEEMVARTHERAAELYESWLEQRSDGTGSLRARAERHREQAADVRSVLRLAARSLDGFEMRLSAGTPATAKGRHLVVLAGLQHLRHLLDRRIDEMVAASREDGASWAEVASALRVARQTAHERYRHLRSETAVRKS